MILCCEEDRFLAILGTPCSSWVHINVGTSRRSILNADGAVQYRYVREANCMLSRKGLPSAISHVCLTLAVFNECILTIIDTPFVDATCREPGACGTWLNILSVQIPATPEDP